MKLYKGNRTDGAYDASPELVAREFWLSPWGLADYAGWPLERRIRAFVSDPAGLDSTSDDAAGFDALLAATRDEWPSSE